MRYIPIILLLFLLACNEGSGFNWGAQPYPDIVPSPSARWAGNAPAVYVDYSRVYGYPDRQPPPWILPKLRAFIEPQLVALRSYSAARGLAFTLAGSPSAANVTIRFYDGPYVQTKSRSMSLPELLDETRGKRDSLIVTDADKQASASIAPPPAANNWNGVVYLRASHRKISSAVCWLNVYAYEYYADLAAQYPDLHLDIDELFAQYIEGVGWHEAGHWCWGLSDDIDGALDADGKQIGGLMNYKLLIKRPNKYERAVIEWLYE